MPFKLRINTKDRDATNAQVGAYGNKIIIPLDFETLDSLIPYHQSGLGNGLSYKITFNDYGRVIV